MVKSNVLTPLRGKANPFLPIAASPGSFTMDLMEISSYVIDNPDKPLYADTNVLNANRYAGGHSYALVLIETTSRKLFAYPLKNKNSDTVLTEFKKFMKEIHGRIQYLTMDSGGEYSKVKKYLKEDKDYLNVKINEVVAAEGRHTALSRVDRVIRTLREMLFNYFAEYEKFNWHEVLPYFVNVYNNTKHSALWLYTRLHDKVYFSPNQVYNSSRLMKMISQKDRVQRKTGKRYIKKMDKGDKFHYMVNTGAFSKGSKRGLVSRDTVKLVERIGNSFKVKSTNPNLDGKIIPYRNLVKANPSGKPNSRLLSALFSELDKMIDVKKIETDKPRKIKPKRNREEEALRRNYLRAKDHKKAYNNNIIEGRTRSQSKKK